MANQLAVWIKQIWRPLISWIIPDYFFWKTLAAKFDLKVLFFMTYQERILYVT